MAGQMVKNTASMMPGAAANAPVQEAAKKSIMTVMNGILDSDGYRKRFEELLGERTPQFISGLVTIVNGEPKLQQAFRESPLTVVQAGLRAASYDLSIDPGMGHAYIQPFNNSKKNADGTYTKRMEAAFVMGYKGMIQLALRTGMYSRLNVTDIREGETFYYDRLWAEAKVIFEDNYAERIKKPIVGWVACMRLLNGFEHMEYMPIEEIRDHEKQHRQGQYMTKGWRDSFEAMAAKTVLRKLLTHYGVQSIDYKNATPAMLAAAEAIATGKFDDLDDNDIEIVPEDVVDAAEPTEGAAQE